MGSMITLSIGGLDVDWGKNSSFEFHGEIFQRGDLTQVKYEYVDDLGERVDEWKEGASRPLASVVARLELLGFTLEECAHAYDLVARSQGYGEPTVPFATVAEAFRRLDITRAADEYRSSFNYGQLFARRVCEPLLLSDEEKEDSEFVLAQTMEHLHPYYVLRLIAENSDSLGHAVVWAFADIVDNEWIERDEIVSSFESQRPFLLVTEGTSDARVIERAISFLRPEIADFFRFIDAEQSFPFTGSDLYRFCQGLAVIGVENKVLAIYDNDAEGSMNAHRTRELHLPHSMRVTSLPSLERFTAFRTIGPQGEAFADINGRAVAIESYLDLVWNVEDEPRVRWTSFRKDTEEYQGELENKKAYADRFLSMHAIDPGYDLSGLQAVVDLVVSECVEIATRMLRRNGGRPIET